MRRVFVAGILIGLGIAAILAALVRIPLTKTPAVTTQPPSNTVRELIEQLHDEEKGPAAQATLIAFGSQAVPDLIQRTHSPNWWSRWDGINILGYIGDKQGLNAIVERALYDDEPHVRWRAIWAMGAFDNKEISVRLLNALEAVDPTVKWNAAVALSAMRRQEAIPVLCTGLESPDEWIQWEAVNALGVVYDEQTSGALARLLKFGAPAAVEQEIVVSLGRIGDERAVPALKTALSHISSGVRWRAVGALAAINDPSALPALHQRLPKEMDDQTRMEIRTAIAALSALDGQTEISKN